MRVLVCARGARAAGGASRLCEVCPDLSTSSRAGGPTDPQRVPPPPPATSVQCEVEVSSITIIAPITTPSGYHLNKAGSGRGCLGALSWDIDYRAAVLVPLYGAGLLSRLGGVNP